MINNNKKYPDIFLLVYCLINSGKSINQLYETIQSGLNREGKEIFSCQCCILKHKCYLIFWRRLSIATYNESACRNFYKQVLVAIKEFRSG